MQPNELNILYEAILQINNSYLDNDKVQDMRFSTVGFSNADIWEAAKKERAQGITRSLVLNGEVFRWSVSNAMEALLSELDIKISGGKNIAAHINSKNEHPLLITAQVDEALASAQLAGAAITKKTAKELLLKKRSPVDVNQQIILNLFRAIAKVATVKEASFTIGLIQELHAQVTKETLMLKNIGRFRTNNKIDTSGVHGDAKLQLNDAKNIAANMQWLCDFMNNDAHPFFIHPLIKASIIQYLFTAIRPFRDANGRMARLLAYWYLLRKDYWALQYMSLSNVMVKLKPQYLKSFLQVQKDDNDMGYFIHFEMQCIKMATKALTETLQKTTKEVIANEFAPQNDFNNRQAQALKWIKDDAEKTITIRELRSNFGVSKETARTDLTQLVEQGWLQYFNLNKKTYVFKKGAAFDHLLSQIIKP